MVEQKKSLETQIKNNGLVIKLNPEIYPLEAVYGACYVFIDRAYLFLDGDPKKEIRVSLKGKTPLRTKELKALSGEFKNELLNYVLRLSIAKNTKKIREIIVERALFSVLPHEEQLEKIEKPQDNKKEVTESDPLGIAVPWEEKYGKKKKNEN